MCGSTTKTVTQLFIQEAWVTICLKSSQIGLGESARGQEIYGNSKKKRKGSLKREIESILDSPQNYMLNTMIYTLELSERHQNFK